MADATFHAAPDTAAPDAASSAATNDDTTLATVFETETLMQHVEMNKKILVCDVCGGDMVGDILLFCHPPETAEKEDRAHRSHSGCVACFDSGAHVGEGGECVPCRRLIADGTGAAGRATVRKQINAIATTCCSNTLTTLTKLEVAREKQDEARRNEGKRRRADAVVRTKRKRAAREFYMSLPDHQADLIRNTEELEVAFLQKVAAKQNMIAQKEDVRRELEELREARRREQLYGVANGDGASLRAEEEVRASALRDAEEARAAAAAARREMEEAKAATAAARLQREQAMLTSSEDGEREPPLGTEGEVDAVRRQVEAAKEDAQRKVEESEANARRGAAEAIETAQREAKEKEAETRQEATRAIEMARREAEEAVETARREAEEAAEKARREAEEAAEKARREADEAVEAARREAEEVAALRTRSSPDPDILEAVRREGEESVREEMVDAIADAEAAAREEAEVVASELRAQVAEAKRREEEARRRAEEGPRQGRPRKTLTAEQKVNARESRLHRDMLVKDHPKRMREIEILMTKYDTLYDVASNFVAQERFDEFRSAVMDAVEEIEMRYESNGPDVEDGDA